MKRVRLNSGALALAIATASEKTTELPPEASSGWDELVTAGLATAVGVLELHWAQALAVMSRARLVHHLASQHGDLVHLTDIFVDGGFTISVLRRQQIDLETGQVTGIDPQAELTVALGDQVWTLAKRTLPPFNEFTADPKQVLAENEQAVEVPEELLAELAAAATAGSDLGEVLTKAPHLPTALRDFLEAEASLTCLTVVLRDEHSAPGIALMFWVRGQNGCYRIASGDRPGIFATHPGDVGFHLIWTTLGAYQHLAPAAGAAR